MQEDDNFELKPTISESDKEFKSKIGEESWSKIKSSTFRNDGYKCRGCGFEPYDVDVDKVIFLHIVNGNLEKPEDSETKTMCAFCHLIEHADAAVLGGYVEIVNSHFTQGEIVNICRNNSLSYHIEQGDIRKLKKPLSEYLEDLKSGKSLEGKIKLIFTEKYLQNLREML